MLIRAAESAVTSETREPVLIAIAMLRHEDAWAHLLAEVRDATEGRARDALAALATLQRRRRARRAHARGPPQERGDPVFEAFAREKLE